MSRSLGTRDSIFKRGLSTLAGMLKEEKVGYGLLAVELAAAAALYLGGFFDYSIPTQNKQGIEERYSAPIAYEAPLRR
jgi:hypothetical protein